ncbi:MAG TPA: TIGR03619 family F420-dependent LLM class oxidoreductase [Jatrophihabitantaceae bacterium]|jgi:probable F420-dependent oxidoreductase|nr:TIGR03619 family F420-dependent LLM class oxidoreductase [Jatrophihabitantaceae bacterium]
MTVGVMISGMVPHVISDLRDLAELAGDLEGAGVGEFVIGEHLLQAPGMAHPGDSSGKLKWDYERPFLEPYVALAAISARTSTAHLTTGAVLGATRPAVLLAKTVASLDVLSGGRASLGVASGWWAPELSAAGVKMEDRLAKVDELIAVCRLLWGEQPVSFSGKWTSFDNVWSYPRPLRGARTPIWFGGRPSTGTMNRVVRACDGWMGSQAASLDDVAKAVQLLKEACERHGRPISELGIRATVPPSVREGGGGFTQILGRACSYAEQLVCLGVTNVCLPLAQLVTSRDEACQFVEAFKDAIAGSAAASRLI